MDYLELMDLDEQQKLNHSIAYSEYNEAYKTYKLTYNKTKAANWATLNRKEKALLTKELSKSLKQLERSKSKYVLLCQKYGLKPESPRKYFY